MITNTIAQPRPARAVQVPAASPLGVLGSWSYRHRRLVVAVWLVALLAITAAGRMTGSRFAANLSGGNTVSQQAASFLSARFPAQAGDVAQVVFATTAPVTSPTDRARISRTLSGLATLPYVESVHNPFRPGTGQVSADGHIAYGLVQFSRSGDAIPGTAVTTVISRAQAADAPGFEVQLGGTPIQNAEKPAFGKSEALGILAAIVILLLAFGSVVAMVLPIATAIVAVGATSGLLGLLSHAVTVPTFGPELAALVGLGVGIDYALFVVTRYRAAIGSGATPHDATVTALAISGRAVVFAGSTVTLSLLGLFLLGLPFIYGAALGAILAVLLVMTPSDAGRNRCSAGPGCARDPLLVAAARLHRRRDQPGALHHPPGIRPAGEGLRARSQRAARGRGGSAAGERPARAGNPAR